MKIAEERIELEKMIESSNDKMNQNIVPGSEMPPELSAEPAFMLDFEKLRKDCDSKARKMIKNATGLMLSDEMVKENPYLKNKMAVDIISLSGMLYQMKVNEQMQETLMEEVRSGSMHNRMFEVFGQLSKTIADLNKQLLQTVEAIKSTYRDVKIDIKDKQNELKAIGPSESGLMRNERGIVALGTKELIKETKKLRISQMNEIKDVKIELY